MHIPVESFGRCRNARNCHSLDVILGDGVCQSCWDYNRGEKRGERAKPLPLHLAADERGDKDNTVIEVEGL